MIVVNMINGKNNGPEEIILQKGAIKIAKVYEKMKIYIVLKNVQEMMHFIYIHNIRLKNKNNIIFYNNNEINIKKCKL